MRWFILVVLCVGHTTLVLAQDLPRDRLSKAETAYQSQQYEAAFLALSEMPGLLGVVPLQDRPKGETRAAIFFDLGRIRLAQGDTAKANTILAYVFALDENADHGILGVGEDLAYEQTLAHLKTLRRAKRQNELDATTFWGAAGRSLVLPGWGHFYKGRKKRGYLFMGATALAVLNWFVADRAYQNAYDEYRATQIGELNLDQRIGDGSDPLPFQQRFERAQSKASRANLALGILAGVWMAGIVDHVVVGPAYLGLRVPIH